MRTRATLFWLCVLFVICLIPTGTSHGLTSWPRQRGLLGYNNYGLKILSADAPADYCPHCLNGGGTASVAKNTPDGLWTPYEPTNPAFRFRTDHGICGDKKGIRDHMAPDGQYYTGETIATYEEGDYIDMEMHVSAHHNGYFEFFACSLDCCGQDDISRKCFKDECCRKLMRVPHKSCESGWDRICGPVDPKHPGRWYLPPRNEKTPEDNWYGGLNKKMRYALPNGMTCERCAIHWAWTTANSCNPPGYAEYNFPQKWKGIPGDGGSIGSINTAFGTCGDSEINFPEEFWSCSENVRIVPKNLGKSRTLQVFRNGEMNIEGPSDTTSTQLLQPLEEPVDRLPKAETSEARPTSTPSPTGSPSLKSSKEQQHKSQAPPLVVPRSKYDLSSFVTTYDTGVCMKGNSEVSYCQACLDLGYGVTKCLWCHVDTAGKEVCLHEKPE